MASTTDPQDPRLSHGVDREPVSQADVYLVLSEEERAKGFARPLYTMGLALCETYARSPSFYGATYCCGCMMHRPAGAAGEFTWLDEQGNDTHTHPGGDVS